MTIENLKKLIAHYHSQGESVKDPTDFVIEDGPDLILQALNNARLEAEQGHDFESCYVFADLVVDEVAGGSLDDCKLHGTDTAVRMKTVEVMGRFTTAGNFFPVDWKRMRGHRRDQTELHDLSNTMDPDYRYPDDGTWESQQCNGSMILLRGQQVYIHPTGTAGTTRTLGVEGQRWLDEYTDDTAADADVFLKHGYNYLMWAGVCELNFLLRKFAPREEGNIPAPVREKAAALEAFMRWDTFSMQR